VRVCVFLCGYKARDPQEAGADPQAGAPARGGVPVCGSRTQVAFSSLRDENLCIIRAR